MTPSTSSAEQAILDDFGKKLWNAADRLRGGNDGGRRGAISVYGQGKRTVRPFGIAKRARRVRPNLTRPKQSNPTTWRLAAMNMAIRGIDFNFGKQPADTFLNDQHLDLRADYVMANPPFNISEWWDGKLEGDPRWVYGTPPKSNANFAWVQHMLHHLAPTSSMAPLLANGPLSSNTKGEGAIHRFDRKVYPGLPHPIDAN